MDQKAAECYSLVVNTITAALSGSATNTERSLSGRDLHMILKRDPEAFQEVKLKGGENGSIPLFEIRRGA